MEGLARGEADTVANLAGSLVRLTNVDLRRQADGAWVSSYGRLALDQTALEISGKIFYSDLAEPGVRVSTKSARFTQATHFQSIEGIVMLDYCTWSLAPRNKCADLVPASEDCEGSSH
jgi:hypothetical protein